MSMSEDQKAAMLRGREEAKAVRGYLEALASDGRGPSVETLKGRLRAVEERLGREEDVLRRLRLIQTRIEAEETLAAVGDLPDPRESEEAFVRAARGFSERKGVSYAAWREIGVPAAVLKRAGIERG